MPHPELDAEELLHLALHATRDGRTDNAITYLKQAIALEEDNPWTHYLLGAQYAELQMYHRAIASMEKSMSLDNTIPIVAFQLGLLYGVTNQEEDAKRIWSVLDTIETDEAIGLFKDAMLALMNGELTSAEKLVNRGIELNKGNPALSKDMKRIVADVLARDKESTVSERVESEPDEAEETEEERQANPLLVSIYDTKKKH